MNGAVVVTNAQAVLANPQAVTTKEKAELRSAGLKAIAPTLYWLRRQIICQDDTNLTTVTNKVAIDM